MAFLDFSRTFKKAKITVGNAFTVCQICGQTTESKTVVYPTEDVCICKKCIEDLNNEIK